MTTVTVIIPAYNEEAVLGDTLEALVGQTVPAEEIIVVDDGSSDRTPEIAARYMVTVLRPGRNLGSKAKAQNFALEHCKTDLVLPVDADTILDTNYIEEIKKPFDDPNVVIAAGCVQTRYAKRPTERGRQIEYLFGFHWFRPIQNNANSPMVCSGCCSAFRRSTVVLMGGFPERTIVEDMDFTWTQQIAGRKAVYVGKVTSWAADPDNVKDLRKQTWRWMAGFMQNVRLHWWNLIKHKPMLATWVGLSLLDMIIAPFWWLAPFFLVFVFNKTPGSTFVWYGGAELAMTVPPLIYAAIRRKVPVWQVLINVPFVYLNKAVNNYYAWKALIVELILVPLGLSEGLTTYVKGGRNEATEQAKPATVIPINRGRRVATEVAAHPVRVASISVAASIAFFIGMSLPTVLAWNQATPAKQPTAAAPSASAPGQTKVVRGGQQAARVTLPQLAVPGTTPPGVQPTSPRPVVAPAQLPARGVPTSSVPFHPRPTQSASSAPVTSLPEPTPTDTGTPSPTPTDTETAEAPPLG